MKRLRTRHADIQACDKHAILLAQEKRKQARLDCIARCKAEVLDEAAGGSELAEEQAAFADRLSARLENHESAPDITILVCSELAPG